MKTIQMLAVMGLILALGCVARAETYVKPAAITVVGVQGEARYSVDGKAWHPLVVGKILRAGAVIETAAGSSADLVLSGNPVSVPQTTSAPQSLPMIAVAPDPNVRGYIASRPMAQQNVIRMSSGTMLAVDKLTVISTGVDTIGDTELDLRSGKIFVSVKKMSASSQYIIKLPNGVAGIRGSCGSLGADGTVDWLTGAIVVSFIGPNGVPHVVVIQGGHAYNPETGEVVPLPPGLINLLTEFSDYSQTLFAQIVYRAYDITLLYISPTQGVGPHHGGGGGGGGG
jgi:hypothetical protein